VVPAVLFSALVNFFLTRYLNAPVGWLFPALQPPQYAGLGELASGQFVGQWWILGVALVSNIFNHFLGEEFLFRGVLLPKMQGVFGKQDWVANAVLFGLYHLHKPWHIPTILASALVFSGLARRFRSSWMAVIVHGAEGFVVLVPVLAVILGLVSG
jgi:membrane protease YdiL (CAAX protease family)